ncbi:hypothetical protein F7725_017778, partial [Dissostichus mawsoni]
MEEMKLTAVRISVPVSVGHQENCCLLTDQMKPLVSRKQRMKKRKTVLMKTEVRVQVERGGARRSFRGVLHRGHLVEGGCSLGAFVSGLLLASLYGVSCLPLQELWLCVSLTLSLAAIASFSMGLSSGVRTSVCVMLPSLSAAQGRKFLLFLFMSALLSGPLTNTLENTERAAAGLLCGAELAANQTQELLQRAATPLFSRTLRNVLHFLVDIGDVCNAKMGSPYRKCRAVSPRRRTTAPSCSENSTSSGELFCVIPSYIAEHLKKRLAAPTVAAFERMKREFDFNISASVTLELEANSSRSLQQVSQDIMQDVSSELKLFQTLSAPLMYGGFLLLVCGFLRAVRYRHRYLHELDFDNVYLSAQFEELDRQVTCGGGASVLPITRREAKTYITPRQYSLSARERRAMFGGVASVLKHLVMGGLLVALDFLRGNVTVLSRKCLQPPAEPDHANCFLLGFLLGLALVVSVFGGFMQRCRRL